MPYKDPQKQKECNERYRKNNREKILKFAREWKKNHKKQISEASKIYREKNPHIQKQYYKKNKTKIIKREQDRYKKNRIKILKQRKSYYVDNRKDILLKNKLIKYKLTKEDYEWLLDEQNGKCAICFIETNLVVDHDHKTGKVRGLLCGHCNKALGFLREDVSLLENIKNYLK